MCVKVGFCKCLGTLIYVFFEMKFWIHSRFEMCQLIHQISLLNTVQN
jgi:hypothetical protein